MKFKWCFELATKYLFPSGRRVPFLSAISVLGVSLGVMILFVVGSVMDGFQAEIYSKIVNTQGDVRVDSGEIITNSKQILQLLKQEENVYATSSYVMGFLMIQFEGRQAYPISRGVEIQDEMAVMPLDRYVVVGDLKKFDDNSLIIGVGLARNLGIEVGDMVDVYSPLILQSMQEDEIILPRTFEVVGLYKSNWKQVDNNFILLTKRASDELYGMSDNECHGFSIKLKDSTQTVDTIVQLKNKFPDMRVCSWQEINEDLLFVLKLEKTLMMFVLFFILLIASFSIASSLMISVVKKRREIGLLCALGASSGQIASVFVFEGVIIGVIGSILGIIFGTIALCWRNSILSVLAKFFGINDLMLKFYNFAELPVKCSMSSVVLIIIFTIFICCLAGLFPALAAAKINPADALRNE